MNIQNRQKRNRFSQLRQSLAKIPDEIRKLIDPFYSDKPIIKGSVYELKRKCGKKGCKCARGELHSRMVISSSEKGKTKLRVIPHGFLVEIQTKVKRYQEYRKARAQIVAVHKKMLQIIDEMEAIRREELPVSGKNKASP